MPRHASDPPTNPRALLTPAGLHILLALAGEDRHGYGIKLDIDERTAGALSLGPATLYEAIHRMVRAGLIAARPRKGRGTPADDRRKYYTLTAEGRRQLADELARLDDIVRYARAKDLLPQTRRSG